MFLVVSATVGSMNPTDAHRAALGDLFTWIRVRRFGSNRKRAYTAAGVNSTTWGRLEAGLSVKEQTMTKVLQRLIPATEGDWQRLEWVEAEDGHPRVVVPEGSVTQDDAPSAGEAESLEELRRAFADLQKELRATQDRLRRIERGA